MVGVSARGQRRVPAVEAGDQLTQRAAGAGREAAFRDGDAGGFQQARAPVAGNGGEGLDRLVAEAALGLVDDALEGEAVGGRDGDAEIGHRVADLLALVEARAADDAVGQADGQEPVLEGAHLEAGAHQDRHAVGRAPGRFPVFRARSRLDLLADPAGLLLAVPVADQAHLLALARGRSTGSCRGGSRWRR